MASGDARFYYLDWRYFNKLDRDFWEMCLDDEGQVRAEYRARLQEEEHVSYTEVSVDDTARAIFVLENWLKLAHFLDTEQLVYG